MNVVHDRPIVEREIVIAHLKVDTVDRLYRYEQRGPFGAGRMAQFDL